MSIVRDARKPAEDALKNAAKWQSQQQVSIKTKSK
jgi:hypothetical protein